MPKSASSSLILCGIKKKIEKILYFGENIINIYCIQLKDFHSQLSELLKMSSKADKPMIKLD